MNFPEYVRVTLERLEGCGYNAYLVGGCVRDFIMGITPHDFDITTNATPEQIEACFNDIKTLDVGKKHGTITLVFDKECVEVTTYRIDGEYKDSRHPEKVTFTDRIEDDLARRDFTMNAIAYSPKHGFVDPFDGRGDIEGMVIRCVGDPHVRFEEDALRILRALRFSSRLGFVIEKKTSYAVREKKELLLRIAAERINTELCGILDGRFCSEVLRNYSDVINVFVPQISFYDYSRFERMIDFCSYTKLAVFFCQYGDNPASVMKKMKFDNKTIKCVTSVLSLFSDYKTKHTDADIKKAVALIGEDNTRILYRVLYCFTGEQVFYEAVDRLNCFIENNVCMTGRQLEVKGDELFEKFHVFPGQLRNLLMLLLFDVIDQKVPNEKNALFKRAQLYVGNSLGE